MPALAPTARPARGVLATWLYTLGSIVFVVFAFEAITVLLLVESFGASRSWVDAALVALSVTSTAVAVRYCWFLRVGLGGGLPHAGWTTGLVATAAACWALGLFTGDGSLATAVPLWVAACLIAPLLSRRLRWGLVALGALLTIAHPLIVERLGAELAFDGRGSGWVWLFYILFLPVMVISALWWWEIVVTLDRHRAAAADLAVAEERLRFAADLHDIQGHHLQVIALKAELAERMLDRDAAAVRDHLREVRLIAKEALEETRSLVAGYREVDLATELENAREVLTLTGAECELSIGVLPDAAEVRRVLALVVREATTNILRHSDARHASIRLDGDPRGTTLTIVNDEAEAAPTDRAVSTGLAGLRERLATLGGQLDIAREGDRFTLVAHVPVAAGVTA